MKNWSICIGTDNQIDTWGGVSVKTVAFQQDRAQYSVCDGDSELGRVIMEAYPEVAFEFRSKEMVIEKCAHCCCDNDEITIRSRKPSEHPESFCPRCLAEGAEKVLKNWKEEVMSNIRDLRSGQYLDVSSPYIVDGWYISPGWPCGAVVEKVGGKYKLEICISSTSPSRYNSPMKLTDLMDIVFESLT